MPVCANRRSCPPSIQMYPPSTASAATDASWGLHRCYLDYALSPGATEAKVAAEETMETMAMGALMAMPAYGGRKQRARSAQQPPWLRSRAAAAPVHMHGKKQNEKHEAKKLQVRRRGKQTCVPWSFAI